MVTRTQKRAKRKVVVRTKPSKPGTVRVGARSIAVASAPVYETWLDDRGNNLKLVNQIESGAGGDPSEPTPYRVATWDTAAEAFALSKDFTDAGAKSHVREREG